MSSEARVRDDPGSHRRGSPTSATSSVTVPSPTETRLELAERLAARHAEWRRRRDAERALRADQAAARVLGKRHLHHRRRHYGR